MTPDVQRYLGRQVARGSWCLQGRLPDHPSGAVVIPSLAEGSELFETLDSLDRCSYELRHRFAVVVVVNRSVGDSDAEKTNQDDLQALHARCETVKPPLAWVDASSGELALPERDAGVGLARKLGFDLLLQERPGIEDVAVLASLDADTRVEATYLSALVGHFSASPAPGCALPFRHRDSENPAENMVIERYELYLRAYVEGLRSAGSPYAFHTVGSAMACNVKGYLAAGGMSRRRAAEDFYFLQQLAKVGGVETLHGTTVYPSSRASRRTPLGTGQVVARELAGEDVVRFFAPEGFVLLGRWLTLVSHSRELAGAEILDQSAGLNPELAGFLAGAGLVEAWDRIKANSRTAKQFYRAFHTWFDALKTVQFLHAVEVCWPRSSDPAYVARQMGWEGGLTVGMLLSRMRSLQGVPV